MGCGIGSIGMPRVRHKFYRYTGGSGIALPSRFLNAKGSGIGYAGGSGIGNAKGSGVVLPVAILNAKRSDIGNSKGSGIGSV